MSLAHAFEIVNDPQRGGDQAMFFARMMVNDARERTLTSVRALLGLLQAMAAVPGPKTVVFISQEMPVASLFSERADFNAEIGRLTPAAARAQASFYVLHLDRQMTDVEDAGTPPDSSADADIRTFGLETVTSVTGGKRMMVSGKPEVAMDRIALEISGYYLLGFRAEATDRDGKPHAIKVTVKRSGVQLRARTMFAFSEQADRRVDAGSNNGVGAPPNAAVAEQRADEPQRPDGVRILLLKASYQPGPKPDGLTGGTAKAFDDVGTMLPFNSYQRIDSATLPPEGGTTKIAGTYNATLTVSPVEEKFAVGLSLKEEHGALDRNGRPQNVRTLLDSSFAMSIGETVAATSSRTDEGAIVVLLTALPERPDAEQRPGPVGSTARVPAIPLPGNAAEAAAHPTYVILIDVDSLAADDIRQACIVSGAFVDGLDPNDRVAILALTSEAGSAPATTDRLAARGTLESIIALAATASPVRVPNLKNNQGSGLMPRADALAIVHGDKDTLERVAREAYMRQPGAGALLVPNGPELAFWEEEIRKRAEALVGQAASSPLIPATTRVLTSPRSSAERLAIVWMANFAVVTDPSQASTLVKAAGDARANLSIVVPTRPADTAVYDDLRRLATSTGGAFIPGMGKVDSVTRTLLTATAGSEPRRSDPAGVSELTSLRRCAERAGARSSYANLVQQYRAGKTEDAVNAIGAWTPAQLFSDVLPLASLADLQAAIGLHTELGVQAGPAWQVHFGMARRAVEAVWSRQPGNAVCRQWVLMVTAYSREMVRGLQIGGPQADPAVLVALGAALELPTSLETPPGLDRVQPPASDLTQAAGLYRQALAKDASFTEARVRFGRVLSLLGQRQGAIVELERARTEAKDPRLAYLASLFLGEIHEAAGEQNVALAAYRAAIQACPYALAARVALARLLKSSGQHVEASQVLPEQLVAGSSRSEDSSSRPEGRNLQGVPAADAHSQSGAARDPWQDYLHGSPDDLARELAALREAVRR